MEHCQRLCINGLRSNDDIDDYDRDGGIISIDNILLKWFLKEVDGNLRVILFLIAFYY